MGFGVMLITLAVGSASASASPSRTEQAAILKAAGFVQRGTQWKSGNCDGAESESYGPGRIETYKDLNGDGRPEAVVTESGAICYGNTGSHFWLLSKQANGSWKPLLNQLGMPEFLGTKGASNWPDVLIGGPGFCFPVLRWNGRAYVWQRSEYEGKPCRQ